MSVGGVGGGSGLGGILGGGEPQAPKTEGSGGGKGMRSSKIWQWIASKGSMKDADQFVKNLINETTQMVSKEMKKRDKAIKKMKKSLSEEG
ncbi:MAG: hypothetical protein MRY21_04675 [Simkaniaceae bacterium]|nr:hypothetical protein [Simkaniaceae bacterium]